MTIAAGMTTPFRVVGMATSTAFAAIVLPLFLNRFTHIDNTKARLTGTFHLGYGCHKNLLLEVYFSYYLNICSCFQP